MTNYSLSIYTRKQNQSIESIKKQQTIMFRSLGSSDLWLLQPSNIRPRRQVIFFRVDKGLAIY